jgi:hypothetical protein
MTRSALIDMAVREAMDDFWDRGFRCSEEYRSFYIWSRVRNEWPRLLASHPIDTQGGSHE